jgi:GT2 family glycosyltransferase
MGFRLVNLSDLTDHPSPNYLLVLQKTQEEAIAADAGLLIVESDVVVKKDTLQALYDGASSYEKCAIAAAVTTDEQGVINYPYLHALGKEGQVYAEKKHCSFCCSLLTPEFLRAFDFHNLDASKNWFDVTISHEALKLGFRNYLFTTLPVWHRPHGSRPWKQLKYKNPLKYYWLKFTKGLDKI